MIELNKSVRERGKSIFNAEEFQMIYIDTPL